MQENARHTTHLFLYFFVYFASFHSKNEGVSSYYKCSTLAQKNRPVFIQKYKAIFYSIFLSLHFDCKTDIRNPLRYLLMNAVALRSVSGSFQLSLTEASPSPAA